MFQCERPERIDAIHEDIHKSGVDEITLPIKVHAISYLIGENAREHSVFADEFLTILKMLEVPPENISMTGRFGQGKIDYGKEYGQLYVTWELHSRYYVYRFWLIPGTENKDVAFGDINCPAPILAICPVGEKLSSLDIIVTNEKFANIQEIHRKIGGSTAYGNRVLDSKIEIFTNFYPDRHDKERYLVWGKDDNELLENIEFLVESIVRMENSYHSLLMPLQDFYEGLEIVHKLERDLSSKMDEINRSLNEADSGQMKKWLGELSSLMTEITKIHERLGHSISATPAYEKIYQKTLEQLKEKHIPRIKPLSEFLARKTMSISTDYSSFMRRIESLGKGTSDIISILRTKIDLEMQEQNLQQLNSMDKTAKTQVKLQQMVEGVSLIILSYYMTGLASYLFRYLEKTGLVPDSLLFTVCFIPVAFLIAYAVTKRVKSRLLEKE